jgi:hypothetical protein
MSVVEDRLKGYATIRTAGERSANALAQFQFLRPELQRTIDNFQKDNLPAINDRGGVAALDISGRFQLILAKSHLHCSHA